MSATVVHTSTEAKRSSVLAEFIAEQRKRRDEGRAAVAAAKPALDRLCEVLQGRSGQPYKLRALLYSLWNGQATSLSEVLGLDWEIRKDFCAVALAFGFEDPETGDAFFYDAVSDALKRAGQYEWFLEEAESEVEA